MIALYYAAAWARLLALRSGVFRGKAPPAAVLESGRSHLRGERPLPRSMREAD
jgi:hypothetical protein